MENQYEGMCTEWGQDGRFIRRQELSETRLCPGAHPLWYLRLSVVATWFGASSEGVYLHTKTDKRILNLVRLRVKTKVPETIVKHILFDDDAASTTHTEQQLQCLMDRFSQAYNDFGFTISLKTTNLMGQNVDSPTVITIDNYELDIFQQFT